MTSLTEQQIAALAPNDKALSNGRSISRSGDFSQLGRSADGTFYQGECRGSGSKPYITSADFSEGATPVLRCTCPSRQLPCKHCLALLFEILEGKPFAEGVDFVDYDEAVIEIEAQLARFLEIVGREPDYFEAHAVMSENLNRAVGDVAREHGYRFQAASFDPTVAVRCGSTPVRMVMRSMQPGYDPKVAIKETVRDMVDGETVVFVCHPGYLDQFILQTSSLTEDRTKEVDALIDPELRAWLAAQDGLRLVDYRDL